MTKARVSKSKLLQVLACAICTMGADLAGRRLGADDWLAGRPRPWTPADLALYDERLYENSENTRSMALSSSEALRTHVNAERGHYRQRRFLDDACCFPLSILPSILKNMYYNAAGSTTEDKAHEFLENRAIIRVVGWADVPEKELRESFGAPPRTDKPHDRTDKAHEADLRASFDAKVQETLQFEVSAFVDHCDKQEGGVRYSPPVHLGVTWSPIEVLDKDEVEDYVDSLDERTQVIIQWDADKIRSNKFTACIRGIAKALQKRNRLAGFYAVKSINTTKQYWGTVLSTKWQPNPKFFTNWHTEFFANGNVKNQLSDFEVPCFLQVAPVSSLLPGDDWGAYVSRMLAIITRMPQMVLALGGNGCVAEAITGYAPGAMLRYHDVTKDGKSGLFVTAIEQKQCADGSELDDAAKGRMMKWKPVQTTDPVQTTAADACLPHGPQAGQTWGPDCVRFAPLP